MTEKDYLSPSFKKKKKNKKTNEIGIFIAEEEKKSALALLNLQRWQQQQQQQQQCQYQLGEEEERGLKRPLIFDEDEEEDRRARKSLRSDEILDFRDLHLLTEDLIWDTSTTNSVTFQCRNGACVRQPVKLFFKLVEELGSDGRYGLDLLVQKREDLDRNEGQILSMKIMKIDKYFNLEVKISNLINEAIMRRGLNPNFALMHGWFGTEGLPKTISWRTIVEKLRSANLYPMELDTREEEEAAAAAAAAAVEGLEGGGGVEGKRRRIRRRRGMNLNLGVIVREKSSEGSIDHTLAFLKIHYMNSSNKSTQDQKIPEFLLKKALRLIIAQLLHALSSMIQIGLYHGDLTNSNVLITSTSERELSDNNNNNSIQFKYPTTYQLGNDFSFQVPQKLDNIIDTPVPLIIDYSLSDRMDVTGVELQNQVLTGIFYRAPEFILTTPEEEGPTPQFTHAADTFSMGLVIASMIIGNDPFRFIMNNKIREAVNKYGPDKNKKLIFTENERRFIYFNSWEQTNEHILGLVFWLGMPKEDDFIGETSKMPVFQMIKKIFPEPPVPLLEQPGNHKRAKFMHKILGHDGIRMLRSLLQWNPENRSDPRFVLSRNPFFEQINNFGMSLLGHKEEEEEESIWKVELPRYKFTMDSLPFSNARIESIGTKATNEVELICQITNLEQQKLLCEQVRCSVCGKEDAHMCCKRCLSTRYCDRDCFNEGVAEHLFTQNQLQLQKLQLCNRFC